MLACGDRTPKPCRAVAELTGLGLAAMDKSVKLVYERRVRPDDKRRMRRPVAIGSPAH
jgi:hypothetical protein